MALMFPRIAHNFSKSGYYPTDEGTLKQIFALLKMPEKGNIRIIDPCAGEGIALSECMQNLGKDRCESFAVEYDRERAEMCRKVVDRTLCSDLLDTLISRESFGLLFLNPPYGDIPSHNAGADYKRLEKLFYKKTYTLLQPSGVMVLIIPNYILDNEFSSWISNHFSNVQCFYATEKKFRQVVILGTRSNKNRINKEEIKRTKETLMAFGEGKMSNVISTLPDNTLSLYTIPASYKELEKFFRISIEPEQFIMEINRLKGLWPEFDMQFTLNSNYIQRRPARKLSPWHLALSLAAGAISGVVKSKSGKTFIVKGNTYKEKQKKVAFEQDDEGNTTETLTMIDKFIPVIKAWDMTPNSKNYGQLLTITSTDNDSSEDSDILKNKFDGGKLVMTKGVSIAVKNDLNINHFLHKHFTGDWGDLNPSDAKANDQALREGGNRILSSYNLPQEYHHKYMNNQLWIITEHDRSYTTVLFPSEY